MHKTYVGTEHLLLGLLLEDEGAAARMLRKREVTLEKVRHEIDFLLNEKGREE
jgi:ATP-dependent Clp protease ATP-binding subunit ClpC